MVIKKINKKDIFNFKIIVEDNDYKKHCIYCNRNFWMIDTKEEIKDIYYDEEINKRIFIEFKGDKVLKQFRIIGLEII